MQSFGSSWRHCRIHQRICSAIPPTYFCLQFPNFWAADSTEMTCLILYTEVQCRQLEVWKTLPGPVGERLRQGLGSVADHRSHHTPLRTTRKQHGQRGPEMKWSGAETAKNGPKWLKKVSGACSHRRGRGFDPLRVHQKQKTPQFSLRCFLF